VKLHTQNWPKDPLFLHAHIKGTLVDLDQLGLLISPTGFASSKKDDWAKAAEVMGFEQTAASELKLIYACYLLELEHSNKNLSKPTMT